MRSTGNRALEGFGTINADVEFVDNARLLANGGILVVNSEILDVGTVGTADDDGILDVVNAWNTNVGRVSLNGGELRGGTITNDGAAGINGDGLVTARVINNTRIDAENGGPLRLTNADNDWDGSTDTGVLNALDGNLEIVDTSTFGFSGTVNVDNTRELFVNGFNLWFRSGSTLALTGGTLRSNNLQWIDGNVTVNTNPSTIQTPLTEFGFVAMMVTLNDDLRLDGDSIVHSGATFAGGGTLINLTGSTLNLRDGADVDVLVLNEGTIDLNGQTTGLAFEQAATGIWDLEIMEIGLSDFDRMTLTGTAQLDGELDVTLVGGFNPALNDTFTILSAVAGVNGVFSLLDFSAATLDPGLMWDVIYNPTNVQLEVVALPSFTADFGNDGDVDGDDLAQWEGDFGGPGSDADADGDSDGADFLTWQRQFGSGVSLAINTSAVPEPSTLLLASLAVCFGLLVPRQKK